LQKNQTNEEKINQTQQQLPAGIIAFNGTGTGYSCAVSLSVIHDVTYSGLLNIEL